MVGRRMGEVGLGLAHIGLGLAPLLDASPVLDTLRVRFARGELGLGRRHPRPVVVVHQFRDHLSGRHGVALFHQHARQRAADLRADPHRLRLRLDDAGGGHKRCRDHVAGAGDWPRRGAAGKHDEIETNDGDEADGQQPV